jgi:SAM-dependent methyltransferase
MIKIISENEVKNIYQTFINKSDEYFNKYQVLPLELNNKNWKWENKDFPRIMCILDFQEWVSKHNITQFNNILVTDKSDPELEYITFKNVDYIPYNNGENDLHTLNLNKKDYDFILVNQTIEHLYNPFESMKNVFNHLKPGGYFFTSVPTINIPHLTPFHFNGYTPIGLLTLMKSVGFEIIESGFWGNYDYIEFIFKHHNWPDYRQLMKNGFILNERKNTVQTWCLVKKNN